MATSNAAGGPHPLILQGFRSCVGRGAPAAMSISAGLPLDSQGRVPGAPQQRGFAAAALACTPRPPVAAGAGCPQNQGGVAAQCAARRAAAGGGCQIAPALVVRFGVARAFGRHLACRPHIFAIHDQNAYFCCFPAKGLGAGPAGFGLLLGHAPFRFPMPHYGN